MPRCIECNVELTDDNWYPSFQEEDIYQCSYCRKLETNRQWQAKNPEKMKKYQQKYYQNHKEELDQKRREYEGERSYNTFVNMTGIDQKRYLEIQEMWGIKPREKN